MDLSRNAEQTGNGRAKAAEKRGRLQPMTARAGDAEASCSFCRKSGFPAADILIGEAANICRECNDLFVETFRQMDQQRDSLGWQTEG